ncbi:hypothetical protein ACFVHW_04110 [Streptomyces sp. NPDC127110]|uniref:hypothetical protein n=1 Tax=Streptomyces sp. NPDC127110 TaxID=3345362 RepID=UPI0036313B65
MNDHQQDSAADEWGGSGWAPDPWLPPGPGSAGPAPIPGTPWQGSSAPTAPSAAKKQARAKREPAQVIFGPVENGLDYLVSVTEYLRDKPSPRDLKYAVLHLAAAVEVLLKARLQREHWSLVFEKPQTATREEFDRATFVSCGSLEALDRLQRLAGLDVGKNGSTKADLEKLIKWRNALQHYGLVTYKDDKEAKTLYAPAVEKVAANLLEFLLTFVREELRGGLDHKQECRLHEALQQIAGGLAKIEMYLKVRWSGLRGRLEAFKDRTVRCPTCKEFALLFDGLAKCAFCETEWLWCNEVAAEYVEAVQNIDVRSHYMNGGGDLVLDCPECDSRSVVKGVEFASGRCAPYFCFTCGDEFEELKACDICGSAFTFGRVCSDCFDCFGVRIAPS